MAKPLYMQHPKNDLVEVSQEDFKNEDTQRRAYRPYGNAKTFIACKDKEVIFFGASGTGKSRAALEKLYMSALKYPGMRGAIVRKFRSTITQSALVTFDQLVCVPGDGVKFNTVKQEYLFKNGSQIVVAGLDDPVKVLSTEFDIIYVQECTEIDESTWELLTTRLRWNHMPYQQLIGDCNPDSERHWIKQREKAKKLTLLQSMHKDNPMWWNELEQDWTVAGEDYISKLRAMSGHMRERFFEGKWVGAEGLIYTEYNTKRNLIDPFPIPKDWPRYLAVDFGYRNPFVCQWWAMDNDGRLYLYRELYQTGLPVEDAAHQIFELNKNEPIKAVICDHDLEDRMTLERHMTHAEEECMRGREKDFHKVPNRRTSTVAADKERNSVRAGIEQCQSRFQPAGDGRPRLFFFRNCIVNKDPMLINEKKPTCTEEEIDSYIWDEVKNTRLGDKLLEQPKKVNDHGLDSMRYVVRHVDGKRNNVPINIFGTPMKHMYTSGVSTKSKLKSDFWKGK